MGYDAFWYATSAGLDKVGERGIVGEKSSFPINADLSSYCLERSRLPHTYGTYCLCAPMLNVQQAGLLI